MITTLNRFTAATSATIAAAPPLFRLLQVALSRFHGAAQPQLDPDYYCRYQAEQEALRDQLLGATPVTGTEGSRPLRGVQWVFIGSPRAKRHVYVDMLSRLLEVPRISMASLFRQELSPNSALYKQIANAINKGQLVPENITFGLLSERLKVGHYRGETGFILDGIPRSQVQAKMLHRRKD